MLTLQNFYFTAPPLTKGLSSLTKSLVIEVDPIDNVAQDVFRDNNPITNPKTAPNSGREPLKPISTNTSYTVEDRERDVKRNSRSSTKNSKTETFKNPVNGTIRKVTDCGDGWKSVVEIKANGDELHGKMLHGFMQGPAKRIIGKNSIKGVEKHTEIHFNFVDGKCFGEATEIRKQGSKEVKKISFTFDKEEQRNGEATETYKDEKGITHTIKFNYVKNVRSDHSATETYIDIHGAHHQITFAYVEDKRQGKAQQVVTDIQGEIETNELVYENNKIKKKIRIKILAPEIPKPTENHQASSPELLKEPTEVSNKPVELTATTLNQCAQLVLKTDSRSTSPIVTQPIVLVKHLDITAEKPEQIELNQSQNSPLSPPDVPGTPISPLVASPEQSEARVVHATPEVPMTQFQPKAIQAPLSPIDSDSDDDEWESFHEIEKVKNFVTYREVEGVLHRTDQRIDTTTSKMIARIFSTEVNGVQQGPALESDKTAMIAFNYIAGQRQGIAVKCSADNTIELFEYENDQVKSRVGTSFLPSRFAVKNAPRIISKLGFQVQNKTAVSSAETLIHDLFTTKQEYARIRVDSPSEEKGMSYVEITLRDTLPYRSVNITLNDQIQDVTVSTLGANKQRQGASIQLLADGSVIQSFMKDNQFHGSTIENTRRYEFHYLIEKNILHGEAVRYYRDGSKFLFQYVNGAMQNHCWYKDPSGKIVRLTLDKVKELEKRLQDSGTLKLRSIEEE